MRLRTGFSSHWILQCGGKTVASGDTVREAMRDVTISAEKIGDYQLYAPNGMRFGILTAMQLLER